MKFMIFANIPNATSILTEMVIRFSNTSETERHNGDAKCPLVKCGSGFWSIAIQKQIMLELLIIPFISEVKCKNHFLKGP